MDDLVRDDGPRSGCVNGNDIEQYPERFRDADRLGINGKGKVVYWSEEAVYELLYKVHSERIEHLAQHHPLGQNPLTHIEESVRRFGEWWMIE